MSAKNEMDRIVIDCLKDKLTLTDPEEIDIRVREAIKALDNLIITSNDRNYLAESKNKLIYRQFDIGANHRAAALTLLTELAKNIEAARAQMEEAADNSLLTQLANMSDAVQSASVVLAALGEALQKIGKGEKMDVAALSKKINETLDEIQSLIENLGGDATPASGT